MPEEGIQGIVARAVLELSLGNFKAVAKSNNNNHNKIRQNFSSFPYWRGDVHNFPESWKSKYSPHWGKTPVHIFQIPRSQNKQAADHYNISTATI